MSDEAGGVPVGLYAGIPERQAADVLVVGAGAAGCALAYLLGQSGRNVTLVERRRVAEKDKLCGGVLTETGQRLMAKIYGPHVLDEVGAVRLDAMRVLYRACETTIEMGPFRSLPRARLDAFLLEKAVSAGVGLIESTDVVGVDEASHVVTLRDRGTGGKARIPYGTLVAADGAFSTVRRLVTGRRTRTVISLETQTASPANGSQIVQRVYPSVAGGCWLIPQGPRAIAGCLFFPEASAEPVGDQRGMLREFAEELGCPMGRLRGAPIPTGDDILLRTPGGTCFIGDAAGLVEPALGAGIQLALQSALALSRDLVFSERYEDAMGQRVAILHEKARSVADAYLHLALAALLHVGR